MKEILDFITIKGDGPFGVSIAAIRQHCYTQVVDAGGPASQITQCPKLLADIHGAVRLLHDEGDIYFTCPCDDPFDARPLKGLDDRDHFQAVGDDP